jgi:tetratricopeptide (TPR) repeat protein/predicted Ser/Thr protein kinase
MPDLIGKTLGPYRVVEQIGLGGMATVYKAYQPSMDRYVALKVLSTHLAQETTFVKRFQQEAKVIAKLEHLHILPVYDHGEEGGYLYLVMRYVEAGTLKDWLEKGPLSLDDVRRVVTQIGSALEYAHQLGVIHRDIKPSNVLVTPQGDCYLTDFGIAKMVEGTLGLTGSGVIGTPHYMAPEQSQSLKVDHRADVYAMGVVIYEMVTGRVPFDAETPFAVVMKHVTEPLPLPRNLRPDLPEAVELVILRALAKDPADRYQSMRDLVTALDQAVSSAPAEVRTTQLPTLVEQAEPTAVVSIPAWRRWAAAQPLWLLPAAGLALVVLVLAGLIVSRIPGRVEISGGQVQVVLPTTSAAPQAETPQAETAGTASPTMPAKADKIVPTAPAGPAANAAIVTDGTWKFNRNPSPGWEQVSYDDSGWPAVGDSKPCNQLPGAVAGCLWEYPYRFAPNNTLYFRKAFNLAQVPPRARLVALVDDDADIYVNGRQVLHDGPDSGSGGASWWEIDVTNLLQPGSNVLAVRGIDTGEGTAYVQVALGLCQTTEDRYDPLVTIMNHWEDWFDGSIYLEAVDAPCDSGVAELAYQVDGGAWQTAQPHQVFVLPAGEHDVEARATDGAGRQGFNKWHFRVGQPPAASNPTPAAESTLTTAPQILAMQHADQAKAYMAQSRWDEALAEIGQAVELDPTDPQYYRTRASIYDEGKGMMDQAIADATKAVELAPASYDAWATRGGVYLHMGKCGLGAADFDRAIQLDPKRSEGYVNRGDALSCAGKLDEAIADYSRGLEMRPDSPWAHWTRGMTYEKKGDLAAALADYSQAIQLDPDNTREGPDWHLSRAGVYRAQGQHERAMGDCAAILALVPNDPRGFYCRGMSEAALGQTDQARADFKQAISLAPTNAWSAWVTEAAQTELNKVGP